jgi:hypothetical protein
MLFFLKKNTYQLRELSSTKPKKAALLLNQYFDWKYDSSVFMYFKKEMVLRSWLVSIMAPDLRSKFDNNNNKKKKKNSVKEPKLWEYETLRDLDGESAGDNMSKPQH